MLPASHLISHGVPGHGPSDGRSQRLSMVSPCPSCKGYIKFPQVKVLPSGYSSKGTLSFICNANSSGQRRNPDFSRQNRQGYSRNKNRNTEDRDSIDGFEDSESFTSKNGPSFLSGSTPSPKFHSAATPGPREREIVEIFRKVQAQLRERAAQKEEKKVEDSQSQGHNKQNETVDSLLKLLRKHSVQQGKSTTNNRNNRDFVLDHHPEPDHNNSFSEDNIKTTQKDSNSEMSVIQSFRPASNFQRRSPVPRFKYKPILSGQEMEEDVKEPDPIPEIKMETGSELEAESEVVFGGFDESSDDEIEDTGDEIDDGEEVNVIEDNDLSNMKLVELRALAKSRGIKGMSRLKKHELLELLSS
ncbi:hypothetical protein L2E82_13028 [Cichorium intybus]|uniref:Uncharacterized protein n=1 Tax=Cichorium intybus TaxID=13427 RepID=A0ACB9GJQ2_CICIN|nr:hypothetical protein L2E82_13028 [Cichorium intybus]